MRYFLKMSTSHRFLNRHLTIKMAEKIPRLLLFDIDGTLTTSHYRNSDTGHPMAQALSIAFGKDIRRNNIQFSGGTDGSIMRDVLLANGVTEENTSDYPKKVRETYRLLPGLMRTGIAEGNHSWTALPNVHDLLKRLSEIKDVRLALLTGNIEESARIKLASASIDVSLFEVPNGNGSKTLLGAFGSDNEIRSKLVPVAQERYERYINKPVTSGDMVIIGDSPKDIECAHDNEVPCVSVATGHFTPEKLGDAEYVLNDFGDLEKSIEVIRDTTFGKM